MIPRIIGKINYWRRTIFFYYFKSDFTNVISNTSYENIKYREIYKFSDFEFNNLNISLEAEYKKRFENGNIFCILEDYSSVVSYGWINTKKEHFLGELSLFMRIDDSIEILYDFYTYIEHRGKGLYPILLKNICNRNDNPKLIYVLKENVVSKKSIERANFIFLGSINGFNKNRYKLLFKKIWLK